MKQKTEVFLEVKNMKITGFNPSILTSHSDDVIRLFEDMGFEIRHQDRNPEGIVSGSVRLKSTSGFAVDVTGTDHALRTASRT